MGTTLESTSRLDGRTALVTGGGSGIGAEVVRRLVALGAKVCISDLSGDAIDGVVTELGAAVTGCVSDVTDPASCDKVVNLAATHGDGVVDILVNAAGISHSQATIEMPVERWNRVFAVNVTGPFLMVQRVVPLMVSAGRGSIVNVASLAAHRAFPDAAAYCASKAALVAFSRQVAADYGHSGIRSNSVSPGATATPMLLADVRRAAEGTGLDMEQFIVRASAELPLGKIGRGADVAAVCAFLASDSASAVTGIDVLVDSGTAILDAFALGMIRTSLART